MADNDQSLSAANPANQQTNSNTNAIQVITGYNPNIFDPNKVLSALNTYLSLNQTINQTLGLEVKYFRAVPQQRSKDVILQEYTLSCVEEIPLCIKVMLNAGNIPDDKYNYDLMGLEYNVPLEIQIDKKYWEQEAGFGTAPQKKDIIYFIISNRLYQVESSYLKRGFMQQETTWIMNLKKYSPEASRKEGELLKQTIDNYTVSEEELFGEAIQSDITKLTNDKQFSPFNSTEKDKYKILDKDINILNYSLNIGGIEVAQSYYDMNKTILYNAIRYKNSSDNITSTTDRSSTAWFKTKSHNEFFDVLLIQNDNTLPYPANYKIKIKTSKRFSINDTFMISRPGALNFYAEVIDDSLATESTYYCKINDKVINYLNSITTSWTTAKNYKMQLLEPVNLLNGLNSNQSIFKIDIFANQFVRLKYSNKEYVSILNNKLNYDQWYGIVTNVGNSWGQFSVNIFENSNDQNKLNNIFSETLHFNSEPIIVDEYTINQSYSNLTNIRLFTCTIEEEHQVNELLSYISSNADQALILDSCDPLMIAPYINKPR